LRQQVSAKGPGGRRFKFVGDTIAELRKVVWPTRQDATYLTTMVIVVTIVVALALWLIDLGFLKLMNVILLR
jgi:preprotein translocase subunit SecE